jgi:hypothetical protein
MGINIRFTVAVIVIIAVGFGGSFYLFSSDFMDGIKIASFDKSKYIEKIDQCISSQTAGHVSLNSFALSLADSLKKQIEETESEDTAKEILARLYDVTSCEP